MTDVEQPPSGASQIPMDSGESRSAEVFEDRVPLEGIEETAAGVLELYGGEIESRSANEIRFLIPVRRSVAAAGQVSCRLRWEETENGECRIIASADHNIAPPKAQRVALLSVGVIGALLWTLWPFFPNLGTLSWLGGVIAFATYFMTTRITSSGVLSDLVQRIARAQRERAMGEGE